MRGTALNTEGGTFEQCFIFRKIFDEKHNAGEILFQEGGAVSINALSFPKHQHKGKGHVMIASHSVMKVEGDEEVRHEGEPDFDCVAQHVQSSLQFKTVYNQMDFSAEQRLAITKAIIELTDLSAGLDLAKRRLRG